MKYLLGKRLLIGAFIVITLLLAVNFIFTLRNSTQIADNMARQQRSEAIKMVVNQIAVDIIHNIDLGIRSYALFNDTRYLYPYYKALERKDSIFEQAENLLVGKGSSINELHVLRDSVESYAFLNTRLKTLIDLGNDKEFLILANQDRGYKLWLQYEKFATHVNTYEDEILVEAKGNYATALVNNYLFQVLLFLICIPTLLFTTISTFKTFKLEKKLRQAEKDRADFLKSQNLTLEKVVVERTKELVEKNRALQQHDDEIAAQNEEIRSQNEILVQQQDEIVSQRDLLTTQNEKLTLAHATILCQQDEIRRKNDSLEIEVERKTRELVANNQQLEQFAFLSAHNLRAPAARILGLGNLLKYDCRNKEEERLIIQSLIKSTVDLDVVIKDLSTILEIKTNVNANLTQITFRDEVQLVRSNLAREIRETHCQIVEDFGSAPSVISVKPYIDSILFNLISNSVKYRSQDRKPIITIKTTSTDDFVCLEVQDNGIGIDLNTYGDQIFSLYKRFHTHTEGRGLGLHLVKVQAIALGGSVDVTSQSGVGSVFKVYIKNHL
jgi:signal transduction histidine kinase